MIYYNDILISFNQTTPITLPNPFYDAKNGVLPILLLNKGDNSFKDVTSEYGIEKKRFNNSSSFYDIDNDLDQDLVTVNDFILWNDLPV